MHKLKSFFWFCSGSDPALLQQCPTEGSKYAGIGATVLFTGVFAALAGAYALFTVFDSVWAAAAFGVLWGLMIFNLDRYIVSSMRKEGRPLRELLMAVPRLMLAVLISIVIATPLELKIFEKEIRPELIVMEQEKYAAQEASLKSRFMPYHDSLRSQVSGLKNEIVAKAAKRDELLRLAQEEADGTGGSRRRNLGPIYKVKKADADKVGAELDVLRTENQLRIAALTTLLDTSVASMEQALAALERGKMDGPAARLEALDRIKSQSGAIRWAHWFIVLLFIAVETAPVFVKLISPKGPYDNLLKIEEHTFLVREIEQTAAVNAASKTRAGVFSQYEKDYVANRLDAELKG